MRRMIGRQAWAVAAVVWSAAAFGQATTTPVGVGASGMIGEGTALFLPDGMTVETMPASLALVSNPRVTGRVVDGWRLQPEFSKANGKSRVTMAVPGDTSLYGTGEVAGPLLRNGRTIALWNTDAFAYQPTSDRLYQSHPWVLGVRADGTSFGFLADTTWRATLSLEGGIEFTSEGPAFPVIVIDRESPGAVLKGLAELTGTMALPPKWALGYHQCRYSYTPQARAAEVAATFREKRIPCDVLWLDIDYMNAFRVFTFNPQTFADPKGLNETLHRTGFHSVWMIDPGVKAEAGYAVYDSGTEKDVWVKDAAGATFKGRVWPGECVFPDFTKPETRQWWAGLYREFMAMGVDGVWNDMNEPALFNVASKTMPDDNRHQGGGGLPAGPHTQYHNVYGMLMAKSTREGIAAATPEKRPFVLTRASFLGGQRYAAMWTGDNVSSSTHMKMATPMVLNLGLSGQSFCGPDLGGFAGRATGELFAQWISFGAFYPFCRGHSEKNTNNKEPWAFGAQVEAVSRTALERRYRLMPYLYTLFREASVSGMPVMRPVFFADVRDPRLRDEQGAFLLGGDLLVVPKFVGETKLPRGNWRKISLVPGDLDDGYQADLRIRPGAIVPMGKVVQSLMEESLDPLTLLVSLDARGEAEGTLYEDAGEGPGYLAGDYLLTTYQARRGANGLEVKISRADGNRARPMRKINVVEVTDAGMGEPRLIDEPRN